MLESARAKKIQNYIKTHPGALVSKGFMNITYGGAIHQHDLYRIPVEYLIHNLRNGRFAAELLDREEQLGRKLDPKDKKDAKIFRELLLTQNISESEALRKDIEKNGQLEPGIITYDGAVINANRRMAVLHDLYEKTRDDQFKYLLVGILPQGVDELDLWKIEAGLQFGREFKLDYGGVNELLKLREGEKQGLTAKDISVALMGRFTEKQVEEKLDTLKLIDSYLTFTNQKGDYHKITEGRDLEKFVSLQKSVIKPLGNTHGKKKKEIAELTAIAFTLINKTDVTHWNIRELKNISTNEKANTELIAPFQGKIPANSKEVKLSKAKLQEAYTSAYEIVENEKNKKEPERLLKRAKSALEGVDESSKLLKTPALKALINEIEIRVIHLKIKANE